MTQLNPRCVEGALGTDKTGAAQAVVRVHWERVLGWQWTAA